MTKLYTCKAHGHQHAYVACAECAHQYCPHYWATCPRCNGSSEANRLNVVSIMTPTEHEKSEWSRMAQNAYATNRNDFGHTFSTAASLPRNATMPFHRFDALMAAYRAWLVFGEWKPV